MGLLADDFVVFTVGSDPDPHDATLGVSTESSVMCANPDRPELAEPLELKGRVLRIAL
jgi:hypothetical protein